MRLGLISDGHGNLPALETALADMRAHGVDRIVHMGDAIGIGPQPREVLERLLGERGLTCLMGNHEEWFAFGIPDPRPSWMSEGEAEHHAWMHAHLDETLRAAASTFDWQLELEMDGTRLHMAHYGLDHDRVAGRPSFADSYRRPKVADLDRVFRAVSADVVCFGHDHQAHDLVGRVRYVSPGPLGCSRSGRARWLLLESTGDGPRVTWHAPRYDVEGVLGMLQELRVPAHEFIRRVFFGR